MKIEVAGKPGHVRLPGHSHGTFHVGHRGHFVIGYILRNTVKRCTGIEFRSADHAVEVFHRHALALDPAVQVDIGREPILHFRFDEIMQCRSGGNGIKVVHGSKVSLSGVS